MLVLVSVPLAVFADQPDEVESEETTTDTACYTETAESGTLPYEQQSAEQITVIDDGLISDQIIEPIEQGHINEIAATAATASWSTSDIFPDGIYSFSRKSNVNQYMQALNNSTQAGAQMIVLQHSVCPSIQYNKYANFKVTRVANTTNRYIIRLMSNENLTLSFSGNNVVTKEIPTNDSDVSIQDTFIISAYDDGFTIQPYGTNYYICSSGGSGTNIIKGMLGSTAVWKPRGYKSYIEDGVYMFKNIGNAGMYMDTQDGSTQEGHHAQQYKYPPIDNTFYRSGAFKIKQIGNTGQYTIRLMTNNLLTWGKNSSDQVISQAIPTSEDDVPISQRYYIVYDFSGYIFIPCYTTQAISATENSNASGNNGAPESYLTFIDRNTPRKSARWDLYKYSGGIQWGVDINAPNEMSNIGAVVGEIYTVKPVVWTTSPGFQNVRIALASSNNPNAMYLQWNPDDQEALVAITNPGHISLSVDLVLESGSYASVFCSEQYEWNAIPNEGTYYIQSRKISRYASIVDPYSNEGNLIWLHGSAQPDNSKWQIEHVNNSGGYVRLKSLYNGYYMGVDPNDITQIVQYSTTGNNTLWRFEILDDNSMKIFCKESESSDKVVMNDGLILFQSEYTDDSDYSDEWYVFKTTRVIKIQSYYDHGQVVRFGTSAVTDIRITQQLANKYFSDILGIDIYSYSPLYYQTLPDICKSSVTENNLDSMCYNINHTWTTETRTVLENGEEVTHIYNCYCTNRSSYIKMFEPTNTAADISILWSGHRIISHSISGDININRSCSNGSKNLILMLSENKDLITLIHEMAHQFGAPDHYCEEGASGQECHFEDRCNTHASEENKRPAWCIMDNSNVNDPDYTPWSDIGDRDINEIFCEKCRKDMLAYIKTHYSD